MLRGATELGFKFFAAYQCVFVTVLHNVYSVTVARSPASVYIPRQTCRERASSRYRARRVSIDVPSRSAAYQRTEPARSVAPVSSAPLTRFVVYEHHREQPSARRPPAVRVPANGSVCVYTVGPHRRHLTPKWFPGILTFRADS